MVKNVHHGRRHIEYHAGLLQVHLPRLDVLHLFSIQLNDRCGHALFENSRPAHIIRTTMTRIKRRLQPIHRSLRQLPRMRQDDRRACTLLPPRLIRAACSILIQKRRIQRLKTRHAPHKVVRVITQKRNHIISWGIKNSSRRDTERENVLHIAGRVTMHRNT